MGAAQAEPAQRQRARARKIFFISQKNSGVACRADFRRQLTRPLAKAFRPAYESHVSRQAQHFHFLGICGTAMGAVAAAVRARGFVVPGPDKKVSPPMSDFLRSKGIALHEPYAAENLPND